MNKFSISKDHLKNLLSVTIKEHQRVGSAVDCIHIDGDRIYATDGHRLLSYKIYPIEPLPQRQYTIPSAEIKALVKGGKGMIEVDLSRLSDIASNRISYSTIVPRIDPVAMDKDDVDLFEDTISNAIGDHVLFKTYGDVNENGARYKGLIATSGTKNSWCVGCRYAACLPEAFPLVEIVFDQSKLDLLVNKLTWNQFHATNYSAPVVFSDSRGGAFAEMIYLVMPVQIHDRTYLDVALANAI
jgi:hypothetical protein